jgi:hypothetical protein
MNSEVISPKIKRGLLILLLLGVGALIIVGFLWISKPSLEIVIAGEHNPLENHIVVDGERLFPSGKGGVVYKTDAAVGSRTVVINGPFIKDVEQTVSLGFFANTKLAITIEPRSAEEIALGLVDTSVATVQNVRLYETTLVFTVSSPSVLNEEGEDVYPVLATYSDISRRWEKLENSNISGDGVEVSDDGVEYFYGLDGE